MTERSEGGRPPEADEVGDAEWGQRGTTPAAIAAGLSYERIIHHYGDLEAVRDVSLAIEPGEVLCLLGHSGCGKTTLLRLAAGIERPTAGRILIDGREVAGPTGFVPPERRGVGLMFQDFALFPHLDVLSNVGYGLSRLPKDAARQAAMAALKRVGLAGHAGLYPHELSGGEQQRVALARAIAPRPRVLLMDEPFSGLDARLRDDVRDETLAVLRETRSTCVIVTHDPEEAMRMADRIALMRAGQIVQIGTPRELYDRPVDLFATRFFCSTNEIEGRVRGGRIETPVGSYPAPGLAEGADAIVCVRPQAVRLRPAGLCIPARLLSRRYLGEVDHVEIAVPGLDHPLKARLRGGFEARARSDVGLEIDPAGVLVFPA